MNRYDPIDRWIAGYPRKTQLVLNWLRAAIVVGALLVAFRACQKDPAREPHQPPADHLPAERP